MMAPRADEIVPMFNPLLLDEPVPENGRMKIAALDKPGFGVRRQSRMQAAQAIPPLEKGMLAQADASSGLSLGGNSRTRTCDSLLVRHAW